VQSQPKNIEDEDGYDDEGGYGAGLAGRRGHKAGSLALYTIYRQYPI
jgi:hypothetical protein